ncbi:trypsin-like peptidase domain-containing protein [Streptomyces europaeiscabiei]|uniref:trypsin-like peptidase domain-containing protein n=1 Tax=Streptomyces europaeiscabiei TaxID=146819 RepID=UPI0029A4193C|nr:trypsin-like peptidase domain-containing protein [Streptomyces europaeiscabiei]MDX3585744.1 trypsin-like peptidase domain-containing protein [Streptomyces europaeiscabiei]MDX3635978.1 trypsin-like peptidase domain-containing protein [Streptomyces europaeiscabiei]MDX3654054.1 trypsin-like peptidase domain-containing protein [Streptomyces europaeiscabiei]
MTTEDPDSGSELQAVTRARAGMHSTQITKARVAEAESRIARLERGGSQVATGFLVGPALLLTAGHAVQLSLGVSGAGPVAGMVAVFPSYHDPGHASAQDAVRIPLTELLDSSPPAPDDPVSPGMKTDEDGLDFAFVRLAEHPPDLMEPNGLLRPRGYYKPFDEDYTFGSSSLHLFHYPLRLLLDHSRSGEVLRSGENRVRYRGTNTLPGASGGPLVTDDGLLVAMHHSHHDAMNLNQGIPTSLISSRILAGPHAELLRDALDRPLPRIRAPEIPVPRENGIGTAPGDGARAVGAAMSALLGSRPLGATVLGPDCRPVRVTDARQVAACFRAADPRAAPGIDPVVKAARTMDAASGNGALIAAVLAAALIEEAADQRARGSGSRELLRESAEALDLARAALADMAVPCSRPDAVIRGATADPQVAEAVSAAALLAGPYGVVICEPGVTRAVEEPAVRQGLRVPAGYAFPYAADAPGSDVWTRRTRLVKPYVLLLDSVTGNGEAFRRLRDRLSREGRPLLVLTTADGSDPRSGLLRALCDPADGPVPTVVRVPTAWQGHQRLRSLALLTGAKALTEGSGLLPGTAWFDVLGQVDLAVVSASETVLVGGAHDPRMLDRWTVSARAFLDRAASDAERSALEEQIAWLTSRAVCLAVGAETEAEIAARTESAERAAHTAQAALRCGTVPGCGLALLRARAALPDGTGNPGTHVVRAALAAPFRALATTAGLTPDDVERWCAVGDPDAASREVSTGLFAHQLEDAAEILLLALDTAKAALTDFLTGS